MCLKTHGMLSILIDFIYVIIYIVAPMAVILDWVCSVLSTDNWSRSDGGSQMLPELLNKAFSMKFTRYTWHCTYTEISIESLMTPDFGVSTHYDEQGTCM